MKPLETVRYSCGDCTIAFDLTLAPTSEWADGELSDIQNVTMTICPHCGSAELKPVHDRPIEVLVSGI